MDQDIGFGIHVDTNVLVQLCPFEALTELLDNSITAHRRKRHRPKSSVPYSAEAELENRFFQSDKSRYSMTRWSVRVKWVRFWRESEVRQSPAIHFK
ncbi:MAG: hypothetical protein DWI24_09835 [Planctomycetota bacterium]|nr:MAG: hypothetical protein DWI24_09835 [Planctomycetota bacterium]